LVSGRRIVVAGGTAGIGLAIARRLSRQGDAVFICGRDAGRLRAAVAGLTSDSSSARVGGAVCDVRQLASVQAMIDAAGRHLGGIDGLVNSAGVGFVKDFEEITPALWTEIIEVNLTGVFNCCHAALPSLKEAAAQGGVADIVNLGSRSGRYSFSGGAGYNTTKFGLQGLTEAMFLDLHRFGIRVGLVAPGTVATGFGGTAPASWHLQPEDVADAVAAMLGARPGACMNWVEIRPARPPA
jgi:NAD(P)-dependent dehydrogenase (short-subunit alcohol dehydrogenase family)